MTFRARTLVYIHIEVHILVAGGALSGNKRAARAYISIPRAARQALSIRAGGKEMDSRGCAAKRKLRESVGRR